MRRNMQNLSFLAIIGVLLSCAFFFSQRAKDIHQDPLFIESDVIIPEPRSLEDIPDCAGEESHEAKLACLTNAATISQRLVDNKVDEILAEESDSERRMAFIDVQFAWEESRDMDCEYIWEMSQDEKDPALIESHCLIDHNIARFTQLESYYCEWYDESACEVTD